MSQTKNRVTPSSASKPKSNEETIAEIEQVLAGLVGGDLEQRFTNLESYGAFAGICSNLNDFLDKIETFFREAIGRMNDFSQGQNGCQIDSRGFQNVFLQTIKLFNENLRSSEVQREQQRVISQTLRHTVETLDETVGLMQESSSALAKNSEETLKSAETVDASSSEANVLTNEAANSCKELSTAINEIANSMQQANSVTFDAVELANATAKTMGDLNESSKQIGEITDLIEGIAHQTNLLSLNASIEAARAGEMGRGFAVVANEVKNLAHESRKNAKTISTQIVAIRKQAEASSDAIGKINAVIEKINEISQTVAASTEEQGAATESISGIMQDVNNTAQNIATTITQVAGSARNNSNIASDVDERVKKLSSISKNLSELVTQLDT